MKPQYFLKRCVYYLRTGAAIISFPLSLGTFVKVMYPDFDLIMAALLIGIIAIATAIGYFWLKKSGFYQAEIDVGVEANPYQTTRLVPSAIPLTEAFVTYLERENIDCTKIKKLLANSRGSKLYTKN
jgi:hypothetical protein